MSKQERTSLSTDLVGPRGSFGSFGDPKVFVAQAEAFVITNNHEYLAVCEFRKGMKALDKEIIEHHKKRKGLAKALHQQIVNEEKEDRAPNQDALAIIDPKRIKWENDQEKLRKEEERRLQAEQRKADEEKRLAEALKEEQKGNVKEAEKIIEREEVSTTRISLASNLPKSGIAKRWYWSYLINEPEIESLRALVKAAAEDDRLLMYLDFNRQRIGAQVVSQKDLFNVPGITATSERR